MYTFFCSHYPAPSLVTRPSSQCYTAGSHCSSIPKAIVCIYEPQALHPSPPPPWQPQVCSPSPRFSFLWKGSFVPFVRLQMEVISYVICLSLSDLFHSGWKSLVPSMLLWRALFCSVFGLSRIPLGIYTTSPNPITSWSSFGLFPCLGYCEQCCSEHAGACVFFKESFVRIYAQEWDSWVIW